MGITFRIKRVCSEKLVCNFYLMSKFSNSIIENITWPAIPDPQVSQLVAVLYQLEQTQWWSPEKLLTHQLTQLRLLLIHAYHTIPFYKQRLDEAEIDLLHPFTLEKWRKIPILKRTDIQSEGNKLLSSQLPASHGQAKSGQTSGSTGQPITVYGTNLTRFFWNAFALRDHLWFERDFKGKLAVIRFGDAGGYIGDPPDGKFNNNWGLPAALLYQTGPLLTLNISSPVSVQAAWLQRHNPDYLLTYPSNLVALAEYCHKEGIELPNLREVRTISEMVTPEMRTVCQEVFAVPLVDIYTSKEMGYMAIQCPQGEGYHIQSENLFLEILDDDDNPCEVGQPGRVIVTGLHNFAMPLLRYEIRDYAISGPPCACGRGLPVISRVLGRSRNMVTLPNGDKKWPTGFLRCAEIAPIQQFQFVQKNTEQIEARLVTERPLTEEEHALLRETLNQTFGYCFELVIHYLDSIPRSASGKFEEFVSEI
jgi:phenylacetate-CoA ligase